MRASLSPPWLRHTALLPWLPRAAPQGLVPSRIATTAAMNPAPTDLPRLILAPGSAHHDTLLSFLEYADRIKLAKTKTSFVGTHYEYTAALALTRFGLSLTRVGRKNDAGIDLIGHWVMTPLREPLPVIIQCKVRRASLGPCHVREFEGSFAAIPAQWKNKDVLGVLVTTLKATKGTLEAMSRSRRPLAYAMISKEGTIQQFVWNRAASERGLEGVGVTLRHTPIVPQPATTQGESTERPAGADTTPNNTGTIKDIQITWMGSPIFPERLLPCLDKLGFPKPIPPPGPKPKKPGEPGPASSRHLPPSICGGLFNSERKAPVVETRGRPPGARNKRSLGIPVIKRRIGPGRPKGSLNKTTLAKLAAGPPPLPPPPPPPEKKVMLLEPVEAVVQDKTEVLVDADKG